MIYIFTQSSFYKEAKFLSVLHSGDCSTRLLTQLLNHCSSSCVFCQQGSEEPEATTLYMGGFCRASCNGRAVIYSLIDISHMSMMISKTYYQRFHLVQNMLCADWANIERGKDFSNSPCPTLCQFHRQIHVYLVSSHAQIICL